MRERTATPESQVQVIKHKAELPVFFSRAPSFAVVLRPIHIAQIKLYSHIVAELIHIYFIQDSLVSVDIVRSSTQLQQFVPGIPCTAHLNITAVTLYLEHIYLFGRVPMVGIHIVFVVGFAHIYGSHELAVDVVCHRLVVLQVHIDSAGTHQRLQCGIKDTALEVVAPIPELQCLVSQVRLIREESIIQSILTVEILRGTNLEAHRCEALAVSSATTHPHFLIQLTDIVLRDKLYVNRSVPVHVPVAQLRRTLPGTSVCTFDKETYLTVIKVCRIGNDAHNGHVYGLLFTDIRTGDDGTVQVPILDKHEPVDPARSHTERTRLAGLTIGA